MGQMGLLNIIILVNRVFVYINYIRIWYVYYVVYVSCCTLYSSPYVIGVECRFLIWYLIVNWKPFCGNR